MEFTFEYKDIGFRLYCEMYITDKFINRVEVNGTDEKLYLISLYLNEEYELELTDYAKVHCKTDCRCFVDGKWIDAKSCGVKGIYMIDTCGKIIMNQNTGYILRDLLKMSGHRVEYKRNKVVVKKGERLLWEKLKRN